MKKIGLLLIIFICIIHCYAQNPFLDYGYKNVKVATLTQGEFDESHDDNKIVEIGSVRFDTEKKKIIGGINEEIEAELVSRFMSIDPEAERYYSISPYAYCANNPIRFVDPDGRKFMIYSQNPQYKQAVFSQIQSLTDHTLNMDKNGLITINSTNEGNKHLGTSIVEQLINSANEHIVVDNSSGQIYSTPFSGTDEKAFNKEGTGSMIMYDTNRDVKVNEMDGQIRSMKPTIAIGHEMLHSSHIDKGTAKKGEADDYLPEAPGVSIRKKISCDNFHENKLSPLFICV